MTKEIYDLTIEELKSLESTLKMFGKSRKEMLDAVKKELKRRGEK